MNNPFSGLFNKPKPKESKKQPKAATPEQTPKPAETQKQLFETALQKGKLTEAETSLNQAHEQQEIDNREYDHLQRTLLSAFCNKGDENSQKGATRVIEATISYHSKKGRITKFEKIFGKNSYKGSQPIEPEITLDTPITDTNSYRNALLNKNLTEEKLNAAKTWAKEAKNKKQYDENWYRDRLSESTQAEKKLQQK